MRFVSWNINGFAAKGQADLLHDLRWDVCALQEVTTPDAFAAMLARVDAVGVSARQVMDGATSRDPWYVSALCARPPWTLRDAAVLATPSPERALVAVAEAGGRSVVVASLALPPASSPSWGRRKKVEQALTIADWLAGLEVPAVIGIDANTPRVDRLVHADTVYWNVGEEQLLGVERRHRLRDPFRELVERDAGRLAALGAERPDGPLAVSYRRGRGERAVDCRYDSILASPDIGVLDAGYLWEEARAAGSDHGLVWAELELPELFPPA